MFGLAFLHTAAPPIQGSNIHKYTQWWGNSILNTGLLFFLPGRNELFPLVHTLPASIPSTMSISCLALNEKANLRGADIKKVFLIELVIVTESWEIYVPTAKGNVSLKITGEGERIKASLQGDELKRADNEEMDPILRSALSQAIRDDPRIGHIWVVQ